MDRVVVFINFRTTYDKLNPNTNTKKTKFNLCFKVQ